MVLTARIAPGLCNSHDEEQASAGARSPAVSLLHLWKGSGAAIAIKFHATEQQTLLVRHGWICRQQISELPRL
jgi:hypothetical protein